MSERRRVARAGARQGEATGRPAAAARPRRALAVRRRLLGGRLLDLLRARRRRRPRPRPDAADLPRLRPALRPDHAQLRRGRRDVPRARRLLELRPPRLQRADRLHRRLGDPDRLPDRDRPGGDLGAPLPGADLGQLRRAGAGDRRRRRGDRRRLRAQHPQRHRARAAALARRAGPRRPRPAAGGDRRRRARRPAPRPAHRPARPLHPAELQGHRLRRGGRDARLRRDRGRLRPRARHRRRAAAT